ncbi:MAG: hypothetical protein QG641_32 [Candidatus Poribacteria bacterium]|nr:hypothetical protein [Candidatus Poribacteria bacterium]
MSIMKKCFNLLLISFLLVSISIVYTNSAYSQLNINKLKKNVEKVVPKKDSEKKDTEKKEVEKKETENKDAEKKDNEKKESEKPKEITKDEADEIVLQAYYSINDVNGIRSVPPGLYSDKSEAQSFYDKCAKIDYINLKKRIEELGEKFPEYKKEGENRASEYKAITVDFPKHIEELFTEYFTKEINTAIENAYSLKAKGKSSMKSAFDSAQSALFVANGIMSIIPENEEVIKLQKDAQATFDSIQTEYGAAIYTSEFHKKNAGKIVFSKLMIEIKKEKPEAMLNKFVAGDYIYGMMYFNGTFSDETKDYNQATTVIWVDGTRKVDFPFKLDGEKRSATYLYTEILPDPAFSTTRGAKVYSKMLSELSPRVHKIKVVLENGATYKSMAEGEFELDCTKGLDKVAEIAKALELKSQQSVTMPSPAKSDPALEKAMLDAVTSAGWKETPVKAVITDNDWEINRNALGVILFRSMGAKVAVKTPEGTYKLFSLTFKQDYDGKNYGKTELYAVGDSLVIPFENIK